MPNDEMAPKISDPSMAISINQTATIVIFWKVDFFFFCISDSSFIY